MNERKELESSVERRLVKRCEDIGWMCLKIQMAKGWPDRLAISKWGYVAFIELKRPRGGRLTKLQAFRIGELKKRGFPTFVISNSDEVEAFIRTMDGQAPAIDLDPLDISKGDPDEL